MITSYNAEFINFEIREPIDSDSTICVYIGEFNLAYPSLHVETTKTAQGKLMQPVRRCYDSTSAIDV